MIRGTRQARVKPVEGVPAAEAAAAAALALASSVALGRLRAKEAHDWCLRRDGRRHPPHD